MTIKSHSWKSLNATSTFEYQFSTRIRATWTSTKSVHHPHTQARSSTQPTRHCAIGQRMEIHERHVRLVTLDALGDNYLDEVFVIYGIIKVEVSVITPIRDLDNFVYHKKRIQHLFYYTIFREVPVTTCKKHYFVTLKWLRAYFFNKRWKPGIGYDNNIVSNSSRFFLPRKCGQFSAFCRSDTASTIPSSSTGNWVICIGFVIVKLRNCRNCVLLANQNAWNDYSV